MGCGGSKEGKKGQGKRVPQNRAKDGPLTGSIEPGRMTKEQEDLKSLQNLNAGKDEIQLQNSNKKAASAKMQANLKGFDTDSDEDEKSVNVSKPGAGPRGKPPPMMAGKAPPTTSSMPPQANAMSQKAAQQAELAAMFAAKKKKQEEAEAKEQEEAAKKAAGVDENVDQFGESHPDQSPVAIIGESPDEIKEGDEQQMDVIRDQDADFMSDAPTEIVRVGQHSTITREADMMGTSSKTLLGNRPTPVVGGVGGITRTVSEQNTLANDNIGMARPHAQTEMGGVRSSNPFPIAEEKDE